MIAAQEHPLEEQSLQAIEHPTGSKPGV